MISDLSDLRRLIRVHHLDRLEEKIIALAKPAISIDRYEVNDELEIPIGSSKLGGSPDLPAGFDWPYYFRVAIPFIAQFRLSEVAPFDFENILPKNGMLYFFYEENEPGEWKIVYIDDEDVVLSRTERPSFSRESTIHETLPSHRVTYSPYISLPSLRFPGETGEAGLDFTDEQVEAYWNLIDVRKEPDHHLVGHSCRIQHAPEWDCVIETNHIPFEKLQEKRQFIRQEMTKWQFLFEIDSDSSLDVMWGDMGMLYVCIPKESLKQKKFEDCWIVMQCS